MRRDEAPTNAQRRPRLVLAAVVALCMAVTAAAITGAGRARPGADFIQTGHWIYNSVLGTAFHVDGASKNIDAAVPLPGAGPGTTVVQTDRDGYLLNRDRTIEFGKSDLSVADPVKPPADEQPIGLESSGAAFAVYPIAGKIVRFGEKPTIDNAGGRLGTPIVTRTGTLWVHRLEGGQLCQLPMQATRLSCTGSTPPGHLGGLSMVGDEPVFVDTTADTISTVSGDGLGRSVRLGVDLPDTAVVASNDVDGRLAVVDPGRRELHLVDASALHGGDARPPITTRLKPGRYERVATTGSAVAMIDEDTGTLVTVDKHGAVRRSEKIPPPSKTAERPKPGRPAPKPELFRGEDSRLYVDSTSGEHTMVVDDDGEVSSVPVTGPEDREGRPGDDPAKNPRGPAKKDDKPGPGREQTEPGKNKPAEPTVEPPVGRPDPRAQQRRDEQRRTDEQRRAKAQQREDDQRRKEQQREQEPSQPTQQPSQPVQPPKPSTPRPEASRPGAPGNVSAVAGNGSASVKWSAARANGAPVTSYQLSWSGGSKTVGATARQAQVALSNGKGYAITVRAVNRVGRGPGVSTQRICPGCMAEAPPNFRVRALGGGDYRFSWDRPNLNGGRLVGYGLIRDYGDDSKDSTDTTEDWSGLEDGRTYHFTVQAVTFSSTGAAQVGKASALTFTVNYGDPGGSGAGKIAASRGAKATETDCDGDCHYIKFTATGLRPNTEYTFSPHSSEWGRFHPGDALRTDSKGSLTVANKFYCDPAGQQVWVTAEGPDGTITSNKIRWP